MATKTSVQSGDWSDTAVWGGSAPANGDTVVIAHTVRMDADESGFANGLASITINSGAILHCKASGTLYIKMNGNIDVNGALYIAERATVSSFSATEDYENVYQASRTVATYSVEETLGVPYLVAYNEVMEAAIITENARLRGLDEAEMMADEVISFIETTRASLSLGDYLDYVEENPGSYYHDSANNLLYIHTSDSTNPSTKTITAIEPVQRPTAGTENRCTIMFNSSGVFTNTGGGTPVIQGYGWHPEREWAKLSADAALSATEIVLTPAVDLQQGDKIQIGIHDSTQSVYITESGNGVYTVSSYNSETKTVTLSSGLLTARKAGDYILRASRPIKITRSTGTTALFNVAFNNNVLIGINAPVPLASNSTSAPTLYHDWKLSHCSSGRNFFNGGKDIEIKDSSCYGQLYGLAMYTMGAIFKRNISISSTIGYNLVGGVVTDSVQQNIPTPYGAAYKNCLFKDFGCIQDITNTEFINCEFNGYSNFNNWDSPRTNNNHMKFVDCIFKDNGVAGYFNTGIGVKLYNCLFENEEIVFTLPEKRNVRHVIESFDHNQTPGNYKAWMRGGTIETLFIGEDVQPGKLIFKPESEDYPVFRDYPVFFPANRITTYFVHAEKDFTGGTVQTELIDPSNDPLIDTSALALDTALLEDVEDEQKTMRVAYKPDIGKQLILRVSVINGSGEVNVEKPLTFEKFRKKELQ